MEGLLGKAVFEDKDLREQWLAQGFDAGDFKRITLAAGADIAIIRKESTKDGKIKACVDFLLSKRCAVLLRGWQTMEEEGELQLGHSGSMSVVLKAKKQTQTVKVDSLRVWVASFTAFAPEYTKAYPSESAGVFEYLRWFTLFTKGFHFAFAHALDKAL